jgi:uncharacterized protein YbjT (DUF2867 family)
MVPMSRCAWIAGGSGLVGGSCLRQLLAHPSYAQVYSLTRHRLDLDHPRLAQRLVSLDHADRSDLPDPDDVFCSVGTTMKTAGSKLAFRHVDYDLILALAQGAARRGAKRFILVTSVASSASSPNYYLQVKGELENAIAPLPIETVVYLRPSFLIGHRQEDRPGERLGVGLARAFGFLLFGPMRIYRAIQADDVAAGMIGAALHAGPGRHIAHYDEILRWAKAK